MTRSSVSTTGTACGNWRPRPTCTSTVRRSATSQFALDERSLFPTKDPEALAACIDYWLDHPVERWEMGWRYAESTEEYDIHKSIDALVDMFRQAVADKKEKADE